LKVERRPHGAHGIAVRLAGAVAQPRFYGSRTAVRLLPVSDHAKEVEILTLRHQSTVLQRQLGPDKARFQPADRALLAALLHRLPRTGLL
jgi:hypothetical protein